MIKSMTGYGRARETRNGRDITVELRSVNNRYLDCTVKMPRMYIFAEDAIKSMVQKNVSRGKVDVFLTIDSTGADQAVISVNEALAGEYLQAVRQLAGAFSLPENVTAWDLSRLPDVLTVTKAEESRIFFMLEKYPEQMGQLTEREREVAQLVAAGLRNREIAEKLFISEETVKSHIRSIFNKTNIDRRSRLVELLK